MSVRLTYPKAGTQVVFRRDVCELPGLHIGVGAVGMSLGRIGDEIRVHVQTSSETLDLLVTPDEIKPAPEKQT